MTNMWMVRAGSDSFLINEFINKNIVAIGWNLGDLSNKTDEEIRNLFQNKYGDTNSLNQVLRFKNDFKLNDYVITSDGKTQTVHIGKIISNYYHSDKIDKTDDVDDNYYDLYDVEWLGEIQKNQLKKSTHGTLGTPNTVFNIKEDAKNDILNSYEYIESSVDNASKLIRDYLNRNNLGNGENTRYEKVFNKFRQLFSPEILENLQGMDILNKLFSHDGDKNNLCYYLEFSNDYKFAGSIAGGSAYKFGLFKHSKTQQWTTGSSRKSKEVNEFQAIEIATKIRDAIVNGAKLIENRDLNTISDYMHLEIDLGKIFSNCGTSHVNQWIHKYYVLMFPEKFPNVHWDKMKKDFLSKVDITPQDWTYALDAQFKLLSEKADVKLYSLIEVLNNLDKSSSYFESDLKRNLIYFGAPGTGKSYNLNQDKDDLLENYPDNYERVTFHPDYSYANFVGTYKPVPKGEDITYKYVPGPFMRILKKSLENPDKPYLLIIEEINRANVAAIFGDVFQLLDRNENYESEYDIDTSQDMKTYIADDKIKLPQNLFIWATMNSADQGVFPMDTAFKRRWDFKYFSINHDEYLIKDTQVIINNKTIYWNDLRKQINDELLSYNINEDKLMGPFFAFNEYKNNKMPEDIFKDIFKNKIIMYLFEDAAKSRRKELFKGAGNIKDSKNITYSEICELIDNNQIIEIFSDKIKNYFLDDEE